MAEFLLIGDCHIGRLQSLFPDKPWLDWTFAPLRQIEEYAKNNGIRNLIQLGDVFDVASPSQDLLRALVKFLLHSELTWHFNLGNHDVSHRGNNSLILLKYLARRKRLNNCYFFTSEVKIELDKIPVVFLPWPKTTSRLLTKPSLVIAHVERGGALYDNGHRVNNKPFKLGKHFWAIGHLHRYQVIDRGIFTGALSQLRYGDVEQQYFVHLRAKSLNNKLKIKFKPVKLVPQFVLRDLTINKLDDLKQLNQIEENHYIRLLIHQDVAVPTDYFNHPQVIRHRFFGDKRDLRAIKSDNFNLQIAQATVQSRTKALKIWLRQSTDLSKSRIKYAVKYAQSLEAKVLR